MKLNENIIAVAECCYLLNVCSQVAPFFHGEQSDLKGEDQVENSESASIK